ncbi:MAG TPA: DUF3108 domain-containing protein [Prolixibacteraceae bacterium]|nr:DUF3108 domain-containing protein [Prolixibacteraceae bacterium]
MLIRACFLFFLLQITFSVDAQEIFNPPIKPNNAFKAGEKLSFQLKYGFISAGIATLKLSEVASFGKTVFYSSAIVQTTGLADDIYGVKDIYESWFDQETNLPYKQISNVKEGRYTKYNEVVYDRTDNSIHSKLSGKHAVPPKILDLASTFYYIRRVDFSKVSEGDSLLLNMYFSDEIFPFRFVYKGKETIRTKFGKVNCIKINPIVEVGRMFKRNDDVTIWFTNDNNRLPVMVSLDIRIVGIVNLKLIDYENTANPVTFQK